VEGATSETKNEIFCSDGGVMFSNLQMFKNEKEKVEIGDRREVVLYDDQ
jgi:hypothetical protein